MTDRVEAVKEYTEALIHYGVKGMKWGVRRDRSSRVTVSQKGKKTKTSGGVGRKPSSDSTRSHVYRQIARKSGHQALTNQQLRAYTERLALESRARQLESEKRREAVKFVEKALREYERHRRASGKK